MNKAALSNKDIQYRDFALNGNLWKVTFQVGFPLALYQSLNMIFKILDTMMAAYIGGSSVSAVAYLSQINLMISAIGGGLAIGGSLKISSAYGAGDYEMVKKRVSSLFGMCTFLGMAVLLIILPFTKQFLAFANTPDELIELGSKYFSIELISMVIMFFNNVYIAIERSRGNSKRILYLNTVVIVVKLGLTALCVYILRTDITMIAVATLVSQFLFFMIAIKNMNVKDNAFGFSLKSMTFQKEVIQPMVSISFPVIVERAAFQLGKVVVNAMSGVYGSLTVGALGISNNIGGLTTSHQSGVQEGGAAVISQNLGAGKVQRALDAFKCVLAYNLVIGILGLILTTVYMEQISFLFANNVNGVDRSFQELIMKVYHYESLGGCIPLGINAAVVALLFGFGYTKHTLFLNFSRVFLFRIPILWGLQNFTDLGSESVGIVMMASNILVSLLSVVVGISVIRRICREYNVKFRLI
ncbi:MATE family efflux transporter [Anaeromicropila populeti]|uniref:Putative efflux protein, MATE family n=1 Tax=Anaeromicropila populeti TaxID=37658 RepID=A0A1I6JN41_9FIRM|nr:MATE family efflux transporter [Anaeromicropila populeti]SFR80393.1 putative efflux protein, MATE family [Anaeromicropila populeti]